MRAWQLTDRGLENLKLVDRPEPQPGEREVAVRIKAASVNYRDWMIASGTYRVAARYPLIPFSDGAGDVVAVGHKVTAWKPGDRVVTAFFSDWVDGAQTPEGAATALGGAVDGVLAQTVVLPERGLARTPETMSDAEASTLPCAALTAWHALYEGSDPLRPGQTVLVEGTGGVSVFGLQLAKLGGARVMVTSSSDAKLDKARTLGADATVNYRTHPDWQDAVRELTRGVGVDHVLEIGGKDTLPRALASLRYRGQLHLIGGVSGVASDLPLGPLTASNARVRRIYVGSLAMLQAMNQALAVHRVKPAIDRTFEFTEARQAIDYLKSGSHFGKVVVRVS